MAIHGPITDICKIFKSCFLLRYQKCDVFYALPFFKNLNQDLWAKRFEIAAISIFGHLLAKYTLFAKNKQCHKKECQNRKKNVRELPMVLKQKQAETVPES